MATVGAQALEAAASNRSPAACSDAGCCRSTLRGSCRGLALWLPIDKLFMTSIGFDAAKYR